jgi:hypothetical protein
MVVPFVFWANHITVRKATSYSPFYMVHGIEAVLPFDLAEATFLVPKLEKPLMDAELIVVRAWQLEKPDDDLVAIHDRVLKARYSSIEQFEQDHTHTFATTISLPAHSYLSKTCVWRTISLESQSRIT